MNQLGWMYARGLGVAQDEVRAAEFYRKSADKFLDFLGEAANRDLTEIAPDQIIRFRNEEAKHLAQAPSSYLRRFTYDTISHSKPILEFVISQVGADRVMTGSDYCFDMGYQRPVEIVEELRLSPEERKMILGGTAAKILKL